VFDALDLLREYGFKNELKIMRSWGNVGYARISDILRLLLALKFKKAYIDFDIHFLNTTRSIFMKQFVGAAMWDDRKNAIEITNSAFCLESDALEDLIKFAKNRIMRNNNTYFYTELGPSMFHKVLMNKHPVILLSQNHPQHSSLDIIAADNDLYHHYFLHLTGRIRAASKEMSYQKIIADIRKKLNLSMLPLPPSRKISSSEYHEALYENLLLYPDDVKGWIAAAEYMRDVHYNIAKGTIL